MRIDIETLTVRYGRHVAVQGVTLSARPKEILGILGPNGSGKSSLIKAIAGVVPFSGQIRFDGQEKRPIIGYMPQDHAARAALSVLEIVLLGRVGRLGLRIARDDLVAAQEVLEEVGIATLANHDLRALSGGQRQLVFLAQALAARPSALVLDEPFSALDIRHQIDVAALIERLTHRRQLTTILVLHDLTMAARLADRVAILSRHALVAEGPCATTLTCDNVTKVFKVQAEVECSADGSPRFWFPFPRMDGTEPS